MEDTMDFDTACEVVRDSIQQWLEDNGEQEDSIATECVADYLVTEELDAVAAVNWHQSHNALVTMYNFARHMIDKEGLARLQ
jgi:Arc/MetJ-type ribon-helix-helix transcriptional regulator